LFAGPVARVLAVDFDDPIAILEPEFSGRCAVDDGLNVDAVAMAENSDADAVEA
jgi:hypothetical protein